MIGFDTNVLLRYYLTDTDEPKQSAKARQLVETALASNDPVYVSQMVLCEAVWVLVRAYRLPKKSVIEFLHSVVRDAPFQVEAEEQVAKAVRHFAQTKADFSDCLIAANTELIYRKTADGYDFGFTNFVQYAQFHLDTYGDPPSKRGHKCSQTFPNGVDPYWVKAAETYLKASGISYDMDITGDEVTFSLDRFSESAALRMMIDGDEIDRVARVLHHTDTFLGRNLGSGPGSEQHLTL